MSDCPSWASPADLSSVPAGVSVAAWGRTSGRTERGLNKVAEGLFTGWPLGCDVFLKNGKGKTA